MLEKPFRLLILLLLAVSSNSSFALQYNSLNPASVTCETTDSVYSCASEIAFKSSLNFLRTWVWEDANTHDQVHLDFIQFGSQNEIKVTYVPNNDSPVVLGSYPASVLNGFGHGTSISVATRKGSMEMLVTGDAGDFYVKITEVVSSTYPGDYKTCIAMPGAAYYQCHTIKH
ncbi:hypothetical protein [Candidatus Albibeggiatoa sp. nov. BB20]|uniref:hypothetical protein n=1 Tax=Candidatus Albibeggiatoa sp. nov. BB20 TaxID=3162723 RepID=UPI00336559B5